MSGGDVDEVGSQRSQSRLGCLAGLRAHMHDASWTSRFSCAFWSFLTIFITPYGTAYDAALERQTRCAVGNDMYTTSDLILFLSYIFVMYVFCYKSNHCYSVLDQVMAGQCTHFRLAATSPVYNKVMDRTN